MVEAKKCFPKQMSRQSCNQWKTNKSLKMNSIEFQAVVWTNVGAFVAGSVSWSKWYWMSNLKRISSSGLKRLIRIRLRRWIRTECGLAKQSWKIRSNLNWNYIWPFEFIFQATDIFGPVASMVTIGVAHFGYSSSLDRISRGLKIKAVH